MAVAAQLGLPDAILEAARSLLEPQHLRFEDWLNELQGDRQQLKARLQEADEAQARAEATGRELDARLEEMALRREDMLLVMRRDLAEQFDEVRRKLRRAEASLSWRPTAGEAVAAHDVEKAGVEIVPIDVPEASEREGYFPVALPACLIAGLGRERFLERLAHPPRARRGEHRIRAIDEQQLCRRGP